MTRRQLRIAFGGVAIVSGVLVVLALASHAFTGRHVVDDEGYVLVSLHGWMSGHALYSDVYSQYGPAFFVVIGGTFRLLGDHVVSFEAARAATVLLGLVTATTLGLATARIAKSVAAGLLAAVAVAQFSAAQVESPLHPTHLIQALIGVAVLAVVMLDERPECRAAATVLGVALGITTLVKVNVGGFLALAVAAAAGLTAPGRSAGRRLVAPVVAIAVFAGVGAATDYATKGLYFLVAAACVVLVGARGRSVGTSLRWRLPVLVAGGTGAVIVIVTMATGSSFGSILHGTVIDATHQADAFTVPLGTGRLALPIIAIVAIAAIRLSARGTAFVDGLVLVGLGIAAVGAAGLGRYGFDNGLVVGAAISWVVLHNRDESVPASRAMVCALSLLLPLQAYPVAGAQRMAGALLFPVVGAIAITDGARLIVRAERAALDVVMPAVLAAAALVISGFGFFKAAEERSGTVPLPLAGSHIRTSVEDARDIEGVVTSLKGCTTFYGLPGLGSFYQLADKQPPTWENAGAWMTLFDRERQVQVVRDLRRAKGLCVLRNRKAEQFWLGAGTEIEGPLRPFLESRTTLVAKVGDYTIYR